MNYQRWNAGCGESHTHDVERGKAGDYFKCLPITISEKINEHYVKLSQSILKGYPLPCRNNSKNFH